MNLLILNLLILRGMCVYKYIYLQKTHTYIHTRRNTVVTVQYMVRGAELPSS